MKRQLLLFIIALSNLASFGQMRFDRVNKNPQRRFDCKVLETLFNDSTLFKRKHWGQSNDALIINDYDHYFDSCTNLRLYNRQVMVVKRAVERGDHTLTIASVRKVRKNEYEISFVQPGSGDGFWFVLSRINSNNYRVVKNGSGAY